MERDLNAWTQAEMGACCLISIFLWSETIKLLEENLSDKLLDSGLDGDFFESDTKNKSNKSKAKQVGLYQTKKLHAKDAIDRMRKQSAEWE